MEVRLYRERLVEEARRWIGTPFAHRGRVLGRGVDCIGLVIEVFRRAVGAEVHDVLDYDIRPQAGLLETGLDRYCVRVQQAEPGDIALFHIVTHPQHVAIISDLPHGLGMIHSYWPMGRVIEHDYAPQWQRRTVAIYRYAPWQQ